MTPSSTHHHTSEPALQETLKRVFRSREAVFPYWKNIGVLNESTGIYMGDGKVLTAAHVGPGTFHLTDGTSYRPIPGSAQNFRNPDGTVADLCVFRIQCSRKDSIHRLKSIPLGPVRPGPGVYVLLMGAGSGNAQPAGHLQNINWNWNRNYLLRWGLNRVEYEFKGPLRTNSFYTPGYSTLFDQGPLECQATPGDSGGGVFLWNQMEKRWELGGVILAVDSENGRAEFGNQTYIADLTILPPDLFPEDRGIFALR